MMRSAIRSVNLRLSILAILLPALLLGALIAERAEARANPPSYNLSATFTARDYTFTISSGRTGGAGLGADTVSLYISASKQQGKTFQSHSWSFTIPASSLQINEALLSGDGGGVTAGRAAGSLDTGNSLGRFGRIDIELMDLGEREDQRDRCFEQSSIDGMQEGTIDFRTGTPYFGTIRRSSAEGGISRFQSRTCPTQRPSCNHFTQLTAFETKGGFRSLSATKQAGQVSVFFNFSEPSESTSPATIGHSISTTLGGTTMGAAPNLSSARLTVPRTTPGLRGSATFEPDAATTRQTSGNCPYKTRSGHLEGAGVTALFDIGGNQTVHGSDPFGATLTVY